MVHTVFPWAVRGIVISSSIRRSIESHVAEEHPHEAGGFLACERRSNRLHATRHVPVPNGSSTPETRFETVVDGRVPPPPRVFYHSHTSARSPSGLSTVDERSIPEPFALVIFAPHGTALSYRTFKRGLLRWRELLVEVATNPT
ncbi:hypothetical protein CP556_12880 [Natrinema sp. CBA1119]|nr:hypothetical protein CP556_12880 [Natrinema sp. CBA1119]